MILVEGQSQSNEMNMIGHDEDILTGRWQPQGSFNRQVASILHTIRMSKREVADLQSVYYDIVDTFSTIWPDCALKPFGSVVTGLSFKNSDVDCLLDNCKSEPHSCVDRVYQLVARGGSPFVSPVVKHKRVPTIQLFHTTSHRLCELSFSGPMAVEFGELVGSMLTLDSRALKMAALIKCWAKIQKVTGPKALPSNALIILIIFFLQLKRILPPVATLQENCSPKLIGRWNTAYTFVEDYKSSNKESLYKLLGDFFTYYKNFDFSKEVVCPYLGYPLQRHELLDIDCLPPDFQLYKDNLSRGACQVIFTNCNMCIQDPFEHSRNCVGHLKSPVVGEIFKHFQAAAHVCKNTLEQKVLSKLLSYQYQEPQQCMYTERRVPSRRTIRAATFKNRQRVNMSNYAGKKTKNVNHRTKKHSGTGAQFFNPK